MINESLEQKADRFANMGRGVRRTTEPIRPASEPHVNPVTTFSAPSGKLMQDMTPEELELTEIDKVRWLEAWKMYKSWGKKRLQSWLATHEDAEYREDIRRRLNVIRLNNAGTKHANAARCKR